MRTIAYLLILVAIAASQPYTWLSDIAACTVQSLGG